MVKKRYPKPRRKSRGKTILIIVLVLLLITIGIIYVDSNTRLVTTEHVLYYRYLPSAFDGYRIVVLADIHGAEHGDDNERMVTAVMEASPDIIVINGDLIDRYQPGKPVEEQLEIAQRLVEQLVPIAPVYYTTGNHEWDSGMIRTLLPMLSDIGADVLQNQYRLIEQGGESIVLAGIDDPNGPADMISPDDFIEIVQEQEPEAFIVAIYHRNNQLEMFSELGVPLVLSGHGHGGMIRLPFTDGLFGPNNEIFPSFTSGVYTQRNTNMVVSRGLGNHFGWTRFLNNPEVVVVELRS